MKVKLLKKVRKRFSIMYYPDGFMFYDEFMRGPIFVLFDSQNEYHTRVATVGNKDYPTEIDCINHLKSFIVPYLKNEGYKTRWQRHLYDRAKKVAFL